MLGQRLEELLYALEEDPLAAHLSVQPFHVRPLFRLTATSRRRTWSLLWALREDGDAYVVDISPDD